ncbi:response regulator [Bacillus kwashiorkori]|uniref:response regulator n=1 Tax=Bacillus kwashiorkori TaxID=1522318 RepID=UPI000781ACB8|nr:response regulator transcription factor [Bacillus kwashiorkori]
MQIPYRVLIADHSTIDRIKTKEILARNTYFTIIGEAENGIEAVHLCDEFLPDIVLIDVNLPAMNGLDATKMIKDKHPLIKVIMLTHSDYIEDLFSALQYGAQGYLLKVMEDDDLLRFLYSVIEGTCDVTKDIARKLLGRFKERDLRGAQSFQSLTPREKEVLLLIAKGLTNKQIANFFSISENTVKNHVKNILRKLHLQNRVQLASFAMKIFTHQQY